MRFHSKFMAVTLFSIAISLATDSANAVDPTGSCTAADYEQASTTLRERIIKYNHDQKTIVPNIWFYSSSVKAQMVAFYEQNIEYAQATIAALQKQEYEIADEKIKQYILNRASKQTKDDSVSYMLGWAGPVITNVVKGVADIFPDPIHKLPHNCALVSSGTAQNICPDARERGGSGNSDSMISGSLASPILQRDGR